METLLGDVIAGLRAESSALVTIGAAAMKWRHAWTMLDQDFYQFHIYDWVQQDWPYSQSPADYGMADKPIVIGRISAERRRRSRLPDPDRQLVDERQRGRARLA